MGLISRVSSRTYRESVESYLSSIFILFIIMSHIKAANLSNIKTVIFDCDGVLWLENNLIDGALDLYKHLIETNRRVFFVTNNSTKTTQEYLTKFQAKNFNPPVQINQIIGAAKMTAHYIKSKNISHCYVLGSKAIDHELSLLGITVNRHETELTKIKQLGGFSSTAGLNYYKSKHFKLDDKVQAVVTGMDLSLNYEVLAIATSYIINKSCQFVATNPDASLPNESADKILPGGGMILGAIEKTIQKPADFIAGKPSSFASENLIENFDGPSTIMIGDRIETDVMFGINSQCAICCLVLSGASGEDKIKHVQSLHSDKTNNSDVYYGESVKEILSTFSQLTEQ